MSAPAATLAPVVPASPDAPRAPLTKKVLTADHPTWCPGCGDFAVLAAIQQALAAMQVDPKDLAIVSGTGTAGAVLTVRRIPETSKGSR